MPDDDDFEAYFRPRQPPGTGQAGQGPARPQPRPDGYPGARRPASVPPPPPRQLRPGQPPASVPPPRAPGAPRWRIPALIGLAVVVAAGGIAYVAGHRSPASAGGPTSSPRPSASTPGRSHPAMLGAGRVGPRSAVPWSLVGPGWVLADYTRTQLPRGVPVPARPVTLFLVDPRGGRYTMYRWPSTSRAASYTLLDWSGDRTRALFLASGPTARRTVLHQLQLATGTMTRFTLPAGTSPVGYTRPDGTNLLAIGTKHGRSVVQRYDLTGALAATLATGSSVAGSPDGVTLAIGTDTGIGVVSNAGGRLRRLRIPGMTARSGCQPVRWWNASTVLAGCEPAGSSAQQLWLVPIGGAAPTALTPVRAAGPDYGDGDAWRLASGLYLQAAGAGCGTFLAQQAPDGSATPVGGLALAGGVDVVLAVVGHRMLMRAGVGCPPSSSLIWFNPATGTGNNLLAGPPGAFGVTGAVAYGGPNG